MVRIGRPSQAGVLEQGVLLAQQLRLLSVPLPATLASDATNGFTCVIQQRPPGTDIGHLIQRLDGASLDRIAYAVADAQLATSRLSAGTAATALSLFPKSPVRFY